MLSLKPHNHTVHRDEGMDSVGWGPWLNAFRRQVAEQGLDPRAVWDCVTLSGPGHFLETRRRSHHQSFLTQLRQEAIRWALWGLGDLSLVLSQLLRLVSGGSWEVWKDFRVSRV